LQHDDESNEELQEYQNLGSGGGAVDVLLPNTSTVGTILSPMARLTRPGWGKKWKAQG
jgi:hypothetical protein